MNVTLETLTEFNKFYRILKKYQEKFKSNSFINIQKL